MFAPISNLLPAAIGNFLYLGGEVRLGLPFAVLYVIVPWIGVMAIGYAFGTIMTYSPERRRTVCLRLGLSATAFVRHHRRYHGRPFSPRDPTPRRCF